MLTFCLPPVVCRWLSTNCSLCISVCCHPDLSVLSFCSLSLGYMLHVCLSGGLPIYLMYVCMQTVCLIFIVWLLPTVCLLSIVWMLSVSLLDSDTFDLSPVCCLLSAFLVCCLLSVCFLQSVWWKLSVFCLLPFCSKSIVCLLSFCSRSAVCLCVIWMSMSVCCLSDCFLYVV